MSPAAQATINGVRPEAVGKEIEQFELCGVFVGGSINYSVRRCDAITRKLLLSCFASEVDQRHHHRKRQFKLESSSWGAGGGKLSEVGPTAVRCWLWC